MTDVKEAVRIAMEAAREFYSASPIQGLELEEVEKSEDDATWHITVGFYVLNVNPEPESGLPALATMITGKNVFQKKYKQFSIRVSDGKVMSMKIRKV